MRLVYDRKILLTIFSFIPFSLFFSTRRIIRNMCRITLKVFMNKRTINKLEYKQDDDEDEIVAHRKIYQFDLVYDVNGKWWSNSESYRSLPVVLFFFLFPSRNFRFIDEGKTEKGKYLQHSVGRTSCRYLICDSTFIQYDTIGNDHILTTFLLLPSLVRQISLVS